MLCSARDCKARADDPRLAEAKRAEAGGGGDGRCALAGFSSQRGRGPEAGGLKFRVAALCSPRESAVGGALFT